MPRAHGKPNLGTEAKRIIKKAGFERAAVYPAPTAAVTGHQEPSALRGPREKPLDVVKDTTIDYPRQGSNLRPTV